MRPFNEALREGISRCPPEPDHNVAVTLPRAVRRLHDAGVEHIQSKPRSQSDDVLQVDGAMRLKQVTEHLNLAGSADFGYPADPVRISESGRTAWVKLSRSY